MDRTWRQRNDCGKFLKTSKPLLVDWYNEDVTILAVCSPSETGYSSSTSVSSTQVLTQWPLLSSSSFSVLEKLGSSWRRQQVKECVDHVPTLPVLGQALSQPYRCSNDRIFCPPGSHFWLGRQRINTWVSSMISDRGFEGPQTLKWAERAMGLVYYYYFLMLSYCGNGYHEPVFLIHV